MGSVGEDYKCPLCGRVGNGGYAIDGIGIGPICTDDQAVKFCLDLIFSDKLEPHQILATAFEKVLGDRFCQTYPLLAWSVVPFLRNCTVNEMLLEVVLEWSSWSWSGMWYRSYATASAWGGGREWRSAGDAPGSASAWGGGREWSEQPATNAVPSVLTSWQ